MNFLHGIYHTIFHPRLIIIPLLMNVLLTFLYDNPYSNNFYLAVAGIILTILLTSYAISMFLGSIKCFLIGPDNTYSILKIGNYYFKRIVLFSIIVLVGSWLLYIVSLTYWPFLTIALIFFIFFSMGPFIMIIEDVSVAEAVKKAPAIFIKNSLNLLLLTLFCILITFLLSLLHITNTRIEYYVNLMTSCVIGTAGIFAVMALIHQSINEGQKLPFKKVKKSNVYYPLLLLVVLLLPLVGVWLFT